MAFFRHISLFFVFTLLFVSSRCSYDDRIHVESNKISVIYEHQINGKHSGFQQTVDISLFNTIKPEICSKDSTTYCIKWGNVGIFNITKKDDFCDYYQFSTTFPKPIKVMFDLTNLHLYGGPEQNFQPWPAETLEYQKYSFVSKELDSQAVLEPYWLTSNGMYLYVEDSTPLFITQSSRRRVLELIAEGTDPYIRGDSTSLKYTVCKKCCMKEAHKHAVQNVLGKPIGIPDERMVKYPIWSTWAKYKTAIDEVTVLEFADKILENQLPNSQFEIDDMWQTCYGSLTVNRTRFPNMKGLVTKLKSKGFRVTIWVHPFVNVDCQPYYNDARRLGYFVKNTKGEVETQWWNSKERQAAYIDFTNPEAAKWYSDRLKTLLAETGIDSFKFDAGESSWTPQPAVLYNKQSDQPETILKSYVETVSKFGSMIEVRSARGTQRYPIFVRMIDRNTNWEGKLGLQTLIPCLLQMNIVGYPFVLPDMIGGNGYDTEMVNDEMFIRWLQINAFMPSLQFSYPPWEFSKKVQEVTKIVVDLHAQYADKIVAAMKQAVEKGTPVNPPLWWADPHDPITYTIDDEYLLGEDILVAPIVKEGSVSRDIYIPKGLWKDETDPKRPFIQGPIWLYNEKVPIEKVPYFSRVSTPEPDHEKSAARTVAASLAIAIGLSVLALRKLFFFTL